VLRELTADWSYDAAGGLTLGADPVGTAILHASGGSIDSFVVRKAEKQHGMQQRIEGPSIAGRRVLVVEDVSTTGGSPLTAVEAAREAGATVVGVATVVDRGARAAIEAAGLEYRSAFTLADLGLS
jgi:orotate phosphoribosyltransferase